LEIQRRNPWWARPRQVVNRALPYDEWRSYFLAAGYLTAGFLAGLATLLGLAAACRLAGIQAPAWLLFSAPTVVTLAVVAGLVWQRARTRGS
jgi:hypothetical protein